MTLIKSISGIRGTIGGAPGDTLNPLDIVKFTTAYAQFIRRNKQSFSNKIVVGRDARISGEMVKNVVCGTLMGVGYDVIDIGYATTPTTELAVTMNGADGGIIITASHNPRQWNALKLLNEKGEFLSAADGAIVLAIAQRESFEYAEVDQLGKYRQDNSFDDRHIESVLQLKLVDVEAVKQAKFKVCVDTINSVGGIILPKLLEQLGVEYTILNGEPNGDFAHNPEPLEKNLQGIMDEMKTGKYDLGIVVDPDVDRLAFICEDHGGQYSAAAVGEVNVTTKMKEVNAVIGGEGNGGVIYPESHYGRDALVGIALFLTSLAKKGCKVSELRKTFPDYQIAKNRIDLTPETDVDAILVKVKEMFASDATAQVNDIDGVKIDFPDKWVHLRKSNTEPIIRVYSEAATMEEADAIGKKLMQVVYDMK